MLDHIVNGLVAGRESEDILPEIFKWEQVAMLHTGPRNWHPVNKRIALRVKIDELKEFYALSDAGLQYVIQV